MRVEHRAGTLCVRSRWLPPIELHWTLVLGMLFFGRGTLAGALGFFAIVLAHELGHAVLVRARGLRTLSIAIHWMGGECRYEGAWATPLDRAVIAWGGVLAQGVVLLAALVLSALLSPEPGLLADLLSMLIVANAMIVVINLLPFPGLDGGTAWGLFALLRDRRRRGELERRRDAVRRELEEIDRRERGGGSVH